MQSSTQAGKRKVKGPVIAKSINLATGKESSTATAFTEANWGKATRAYLKSVNALDEDTLNEIIDNAKSYAIANHSGRPLVTLDQSEEVDERALLVEGGGSSESDSAE
jgi:hypothetical protein